VKDNNSIKIKRIYNPRKPLSPLERKKYEEGEYIILGQLLWFYINWENPVNWKYEGKMKHIALWNPHDTVDEIAQAYDFIAFSLLPNRNYHAMTMNSDYFENDKTVNVKLDISIPLLKVFLSRRIDRLNDEKNNILLWKEELNSLKNDIISWHEKYYTVPSLPSMVKNSEDYKMMRMRQALSIHIDRLPVNNEIIIYLKNDAPVHYELSYSVCCLFSDISEYKKFVADINVNPANKILCVDNVDWINSLIKIAEKEEMDIDKQIKKANIEKENYDKKDDNNHGFDTAMPKEILKAIKDGRIKPFKQTIRTKVPEHTRKQDQ
jgi:hypothetical protein